VCCAPPFVSLSLSLSLSLFLFLSFSSLFISYNNMKKRKNNIFFGVRWGRGIWNPQARFIRSFEVKLNLLLSTGDSNSDCTIKIASREAR
jgi:hypothetical protein